MYSSRDAACGVQWSTVGYNGVQRSTVEYSQHSTVQCSTANGSSGTVPVIYSTYILLSLHLSHTVHTTTMPPQKEPSEADIIFNRANVALARSQRLIQSWLPPKSAEEIANAKSEEELLKEDEELFKPTPEL